MAVTDESSQERFGEAASTDIRQAEELRQMRAALEISRDRYRCMYDDAPIGYVTTALDGQIVDANAPAAKLLHTPLSSLLHNQLSDFFDASGRRRYQQATSRLLAGAGPQSLDLRVRMRDPPLGVAVRMVLTRDEAANLPQIRVALLDTGPRLAAQAGRNSRERRRIEAVLRRRLNQLDLLASTGEMLITDDARASTIDEELLARAGAVAGADIVLDYRLDATGAPLLTHSQGLTEAARARAPPLTLFAALAAQAAREGRAVVVESLDDPAPPARALRDAESGCFAAFPLLALDRVQAVAAFACTGAQRLQKGDLQMLRTVCDQISATLGRGRLMAELHAREDALRLEDRRKDDFIATLAHELRNPLAPILNAVSILRSSPVSEQQLAWCRVIERQGAHLSALLEDLLDVSRVTRNRIRLRRERVALSEIIEHAIETTRPLIEAQRHRLSVELPKQPIELYADPLRLAQVLGNLLDNAASYTDPGGEITVTATADGDEVCIAVRDNGIGIETDRLPEVFEMFAQLAPALERSRGGLGIGLALAQGLTVLHGGHIEARSGGPGTGSEFIVHLQSSAVQAAAAAHSARSRLQRAGRETQVLVIDDNRDAAETLAALLGMEGVTARAAFDGLEGLRLLEQWRPAVAVIDIGMPRLNGYALCRLIRAQQWGEDMTLIACTGWGQERDRELSRAAGFDHHLVKPVELDKLLACVGAGRPSAAMS